MISLNYLYIKYVRWLGRQALRSSGLEFESEFFHLLVYLDSLGFSSIIYRTRMIMAASQDS